MKHVFIGIIKLYRIAISPLFPPSCRFYPTCSEYAIEALTEHGAIKGSWLAIKRIAKCHPFHEGGVDLVPRKAQVCDHAATNKD